MVNAWASEHGICLAQRKVDDKSNEMTAIPELLDLLDINGCLVSIDAMGTQKKIAKKSSLVVLITFYPLKVIRKNWRQKSMKCLTITG